MMSNTPVEVPLVKKQRLKFIDVARSIAIILMLEGHFIEVVFEGFQPMVEMVKLKGTSGYPLFDIWYFIKGFTAPMFFSVTGIVFVFLLISDQKFSENPRVKKGIERSLKLLFWGYVLQLNLRSFDKYLVGEFHSWNTAFHVLQSIGVGIAFLIFIYWLHKTIKIGSLPFYYFIAGTLIFAFYPSLKAMEPGQYFPTWGPAILQNVFRGPHSVFPIIPWMAFTMYGGMIGAIVKKNKDNIKSYKFIFLFIGAGIALNLFAYPLFQQIDHFVEFIGLKQDSNFVTNAWLYGRFGQIIFVLGVLIAVEKFITIKDNLFLKAGQNTLPIYCLHVILLYGGVFGYGISTYYSGAWNAYSSVLGAIAFILFFVYTMKYWFHVEDWWDGVKTKIKRAISLKKD